MFLLSSTFIRNDFRPRHHNNPTNDERDSEIPRHAKQRTGIHEIARSTKSTIRTCDGLRSLHVGDDQRSRPRQGLFLSFAILKKKTICLLPGVELLSEGHESGHLRAFESKGVQRTSGIPIGLRWLLEGVSDAFYDVALSAW